MKPIRLIGAIFFAFILSSCQKEFSVDGSNPPANFTDSNFINKIHYDSLNISTNQYDTFAQASLSYDNNKRLTVFRLEELSVIDEFTFAYPANDSLPFKSQETITALDTYTTYHFYDAQGQKTKDSTLIAHVGSSTVDTIVKYFTYSPGQIISKSLQYIANATDISSIDTASLDIKGNVVHIKVYIHDPSNPNNPSLVLYKEENNTYDNNINPFYLISGFKRWKPIPNYEIGDIIERTCPNNIMDINDKYYYGNHPPSIYNYHFLYTYKLNGLIQQIIIPGSTYRVLFSYIHL